MTQPLQLLQQGCLTIEDVHTVRAGPAKCLQPAGVQKAAVSEPTSVTAICTVNHSTDSMHPVQLLNTESGRACALLSNQDCY